MPQIRRSEITRPALRYFGAKFRLAPWIIGQFPPHTCYVEPFGGAGGVLLRKEPSLYEVYNDLDGEVVNFFRMLREHPEDLVRAIHLTPYSREEQRLSFEPTDGLSDLERARRLYVRCWQTHGGGRTQWQSGWRYQVTNKRGKSQLADWNQTDHLEAIIQRLKSVQIEHDDAIRVIERFDSADTLFYVDPPYLASTRSVRWRDKAYTCELDEEYHHNLASALNRIQGMALVSGKPSGLYDELYTGWRVIQKTIPTDFQSRSVECVWISPQAEARISQMRMEI